MQMCAMKPLKISGIKIANLPEAVGGKEYRRDRSTTIGSLILCHLLKR